jgi:FKBP-type peptidyl-prolyl cis-trans isomerase
MRITRLLLAAVLFTTACETESPDAENAPTAEAVDKAADGAEAGDYSKAPTDVAAAPADATKTESGLAYKVIDGASADGEKPAGPTSKVKVHYTGWTTDGEMFDSSHKRKRPAEFALNGVIAGWTEGLQLMTIGQKVRFWIPEDLAYKGRAGKPAGMLVFDVELLELTNPPTAPADVAAAPEDALKTESGLAYKVLTAGTGDAHPKETSVVSVHYTGWKTDGEMFDSSEMRGKPASFPLNEVIKGWTEGVQLMVLGEKTRFWIPSAMAYGDSPNPRAPKGDLVFDVELLSIMDPPETPADVAAVPADATKTESGLSYRVLQKGTGSAHPADTDKVSVHYTGWTTDGKRFDSSVMRGAPATFPLNGVIKGWTEGVQLMVVGEKVRFWIPAELAYGEKPRRGAPSGMLVFDIELLEIQ